MYSEKMNMLPGYAYVLETEFENLYDINEAICKGTLFKELYLPLGVYGRQGEEACRQC